MESEEWRDVVGYEGLYQVSSLGNVKKGDKALKPSLLITGYYSIQLIKDKIKKCFTVHRLIGKAFLSNPNNCTDIDHINRIRNDNRLENLRWVTRSDNLINRTYNNSTTGQRHIYRDGNLYYVRVSRNYKKIHVGNFKTLEEAIRASDAFLNGK